MQNKNERHESPDFLCQKFYTLRHKTCPILPYESYPHIIGDDTVDKLEREGTEYCLCEKNVLGYYRGNKEKYDLIDIIIIGLGGFEKKDDETIIGFLDSILDRDLEPMVRRKILKEKFDIATDEDFMEVFDDMCNLSDGVYLDGVEKGIMQGEARGIEKGIIQGKAEGIMQGKAEGLAQGRFELIKKFIQKGHSFESALDMFDITDKKEVEALKNAIKV